TVDTCKIISKAIKKSQRHYFSKYKIDNQFFCQKLMCQNQRSQPNKVAHKLPFKEWRHFNLAWINNVYDYISKEENQNHSSSKKRQQCFIYRENFFLKIYCVIYTCKFRYYVKGENGT